MLDRVRGEPVAAARPAVRAAEREHPGMLARAVVLERRRLGAALELVLAAGALASRLRTAASCSGEARWDADAIAISSVVRSSRARTSGSAWNGFAEERRYATRSASPACSTTAPSRTATACTTCVASTTSPRRTITLISSTRSSVCHVGLQTPLVWVGPEDRQPTRPQRREGEGSPRARLPDRSGPPLGPRPPRSSRRRACRSAPGRTRRRRSTDGGV